MLVVGKLPTLLPCQQEILSSQARTSTILILIQRSILTCKRVLAMIGKYLKPLQVAPLSNKWCKKEKVILKSEFATNFFNDVCSNV